MSDKNNKARSTHEALTVTKRDRVLILLHYLFVSLWPWTLGSVIFIITRGTWSMERQSAIFEVTGEYLSWVQALTRFPSSNLLYALKQVASTLKSLFTSPEWWGDDSLIPPLPQQWSRLQTDLLTEVEIRNYRKQRNRLERLVIFLESYNHEVSRAKFRWWCSKDAWVAEWALSWTSGL